MEIVRYLAEGRPHAGVREGETVAPLAVASVAELLRLPVAELRGHLQPTGPALPAADVRLLPPLDGRTEVWASGVTYERSRSGRMAESVQASVYELVYDAERPELFAKAVAWRVVTDGEPIAVRADSTVDVPEPELAVVANAHGELVGYTVCNDVSSRSIEGENPLYLPQAKVYDGSCALAPGIVPVWAVPDPAALEITVTVHRGGEVVFADATSTARLHRDPVDLLVHLFAGCSFPDGVVLATGTGVVPELDFSLSAGDRVDITIAGVGTLSNPVVRGRAPMAWLVDAAVDASARPPRHHR